MPHITMLKKEGRRVIENADEVTSHLRQRFTSASFDTLDGKAIAKMSLKEQVFASLQCISDIYMLQLNQNRVTSCVWSKLTQPLHTIVHGPKQHP